MEQKRRENRFTLNQAVTVKVNGIMPGPVLKASVLDVSASGMRVRTALPVPCGSRVEIQADTLICQGIVLRCELDNNIYAIGIQISEFGAATAPR